MAYLIAANVMTLSVLESNTPIASNEPVSFSKVTLHRTGTSYLCEQVLVAWRCSSAALYNYAMVRCLSTTNRVLSK